MVKRGQERIKPKRVKVDRVQVKTREKLMTRYNTIYTGILKKKQQNENFEADILNLIEIERDLEDENITPYGVPSEGIISWDSRSARVGQLWRMPPPKSKIEIVEKEGCIDDWVFNSDLYRYKAPSMNEEDIICTSPHTILGNIHQCVSIYQSNPKSWCIGEYGAPADDDSFITATFSQTGYGVHMPNLYTQVTASFSSTIIVENEGEKKLWIQSKGWTDFSKLMFHSWNCRGLLNALHRVTVDVPGPPFSRNVENTKTIVVLFWSGEELGYTQDSNMYLGYYPNGRDQNEYNEIQLETRVTGPCEITVTESMIYQFENLTPMYISIDEGTEALVNGEWIPVPYGFHAHYSGLNGRFEPLCYKLTKIPWFARERIPWP